MCSSGVSHTVTVVCVFLRCVSYSYSSVCSSGVSHTVTVVCVPQVGLGISTLLLYVPTPLAATHQSGSLALLSLAIWVLTELRRVAK